MLNEEVPAAECSMKNGVIAVSGIDRLLDSLGVDDFLRFSFMKLKNPNLSSRQSKINVTFVDDSTGSGSVVASKETWFPSAISGPPLNIQINSIATGSQKLLVSTSYTFSISTVDTDTLKINPQSHIGLIIVFPREYK